MVNLVQNRYGGYNNAYAQKAGNAAIEAFKKEKAAPYGGDYQAYIKATTPPSSPFEKALQNLYASGVGDQAYENEQLSNFYNSGPGKKQMTDFYAANPKWYNSDGTRVLAEAIRGTQGATAPNSNNLPAPVPSQAPQNAVLRPSVVNAQPVARQQAQAQAIRDFKPQPQQNPSWQPGGWS